MIYEALWSAIPYPAFVIDSEDTIVDGNAAAESFAGMSIRQMSGQNIGKFVGYTSALVEVLMQAKSGSSSVVRYGVEVPWGDQPGRLQNLFVSTLQEPEGHVLLLMHPRGLAEKMDRSLSHRSAARSVSGMAAMLAHEIRNPLAGIRGAAQLLAMGLSDEDREMTDLIEGEAGRIGKLVDRVEQFGDLRPAQRESVNIHDILDRAKRAARAGYAADARFSEEYDPSLPHASGDPDQLLQVFQNVLKNAAEALPRKGGAIVIKTAYRPGVRLQVPGGKSESLPLEITITDNGRGIPENLINDVFDPFVSSKANGTGLGLALVSKIISDHGGVVECESAPGKTLFRILLPVWQETKKGRGA
ncbi:MAG TPA: ATP-binding protein [Paracoccaceae bacterium]|nr:ATP-binding protein [Paracoccaceae bacterium]